MFGAGGGGGGEGFRGSGHVPQSESAQNGKVHVTSTNYLAKYLKQTIIYTVR